MPGRARWTSWCRTTSPSSTTRMQSHGLASLWRYSSVLVSKSHSWHAFEVLPVLLHGHAPDLFVINVQDAVPRSGKFVALFKRAGEQVSQLTC